VQTTIDVLLIKFTQTRGLIYHPNVLLLVVELIKFTFSCLMITLNQNIQLLIAEIQRYPMSNLRYSVPALLYSAQNYLIFIAVRRLNVPTFQITYQLRILYTAFFAHIMIGKTHTRRQLCALMMLTAGVILLHSEAITTFVKFDIIGIITTLIAALLSSFAGVYIEKIMKDKSNTDKFTGMIIRQWQLGLFTIPINIASLWIVGGVHNPFENFDNKYIWCIIICSSIGGILVATMICYADSIIKCFATSVSIIICGFASLWIDNRYNPSIQLVIGGFVVLFALFLYTFSDPKTNSDETIPLTESLQES
jgi:solute carrier family 35 (UDP-sugar transporter), member A1/2/3